MKPQTMGLPRLIIPIILAVAACAPYLQTLGHDFINLDDPLYITENVRVKQGLTWKNIGWAFTTFDASNWHPIAWLSHMFDVEIFGMKPAGHHLMSVFFHAANTLLLYFLLNRMTGAIWRSALVAALFAVHPLRVESVAWVAERKDVLSAFFGLLAIWAYLAYVGHQTILRYALVAAMFGLSLMAKPMLVTLPCVLLLIDFWPLKRFSENGANPVRIILEKVPLLILTVISSVLTLKAQHSGGALDALEMLSIDQRIANAIVAYGGYIGKLIWPVDLAVIYPHPGHWPVWRVAVSAMVLVAVSVIVLMFRRRQPHLLVGWLWYLGTLVPVIGLVQVGTQSMADRYTYFPIIGLLMMTVWSIPDPSNVKARRAAVRIASAAAIVLLSFLLIRTFVQVGYWRDSLTLLQRTVAITSNNSLAHINLGFAYRRAGQHDEAIRHYEQALTINPGSTLAHENIGNALGEIGRLDEAIAHLEQAVALQPDVARTRNNLGTVLRRAGRLAEAETHFRVALRLNPDYARAYANLGMIMASTNRADEAVRSYRAALAIDPDMAETHANLGMALAAQGEVADAIEHYHAALRIRPGMPETRVNLGVALAMEDRIDQAIAQFEEALRWRPDYAEAKRLLDLARAQQAAEDKP